MRRLEKKISFSFLTDDKKDKPQIQIRNKRNFCFKNTLVWLAKSGKWEFSIFTTTVFLATLPRLLWRSFSVKWSVTNQNCYIENPLFLVTWEFVKKKSNCSIQPGRRKLWNHLQWCLLACVCDAGLVELNWGVRTSHISASCWSKFRYLIALHLYCDRAGCE